MVPASRGGTRAAVIVAVVVVAEVQVLIPVVLDVMLVVVVVVAVPVPGGELGADVVVDGLGVLDGRLHPHQILFRRRHLLRCGVATRADGLHALAVALDRLRERDVLRRARGFATRQLMMHRRLESFLGRLHGGRELRARAASALACSAALGFLPAGDFAPRPAAETSLAPAFRFLPLGGEREEDEGRVRPEGRRGVSSRSRERGWRGMR